MALIFEGLDGNSFKGLGHGREGSGILRCPFSINKWILAPFCKIQQLEKFGREGEETMSCSLDMNLRRMTLIQIYRSDAHQKSDWARGRNELLKCRWYLKPWNWMGWPKTGA